PQQELAAVAVIEEPVALELGLPEDEAADPGLAPEVVDAEREEDQERVDDVNPEQRAAGAVEPEPPGVRRRLGARRREGPHARGRSGGGRRGQARRRLPEERSGGSRAGQRHVRHYEQTPHDVSTMSRNRRVISGQNARRRSCARARDAHSDAERAEEVADERVHQAAMAAIREVRTEELLDGAAVDPDNGGGGAVARPAPSQTH